MDGYEIQKWELCKNLETRYDLKISIDGSGFEINTLDETHIGRFTTLDTVFGFLCGYEHYHTLKNRLDNATHKRLPGSFGNPT